MKEKSEKRTPLFEKKHIQKEVEKVVNSSKLEKKRSTSGQMEKVKQTTHTAQQRSDVTSAKIVQDASLPMKRKTDIEEKKVPEKVRKTGTETATRGPLIVRIPRKLLEKPVKQLLADSEVYLKVDSRTKELDHWNNIRLQEVGKQHFEMFDEAFCLKLAGMKYGTVDSLVTEWKEKAAKERVEKLKNEEQRRKRLLNQQRQVEIPDTINLDQLDSSSADDTPADQLPPVSFEPMDTSQHHSSGASNVSEFLESGSGDEDFIKETIRFQSPLLAPLQNGWHREVKERVGKGAYEDNPYYYHDDNKEKHYYGDEPDLLETIRKTGFSIENFLFRSSVAAYDWRRYRTSTDFRQGYTLQYFLHVFG